ncbi:MAG: hypothetical protein Q9170_005965 [Blastenia crenularia]
MPLIESPAGLPMSPPNASVSPTILADSSGTSKKRKRPAEAAEELEVDINAPEPPSKKALRKAKKGKISTNTKPAQESNPIKPDEKTNPALQTGGNTTEQVPTSKRSAHGIWIGNLSFNTTKVDLRTLLTHNTNITEPMITRLHMPAPSALSTLHQKIKPQNQGFAYVDFSVPEAVAEALALSETLLTGRKVLIKDAHNFKGRPEKQDNDNAKQKSGGNLPAGSKGPSTRKSFIGNLPFDTDRADLEEHFSPCGEIVDVHVATFEDSGKCKGYAWITFADISSAEAAVRGWALQEPEDKEDEGGDSSKDENKATEKPEKRTKKHLKPRKRWVNSFKGRLLRMEFAEDAAVRYKKRFGKDAQKENGRGNPHPTGERDSAEPRVSRQEGTQQAKVQRTSRPPKRVDARDIKPGAALAAAPRLTGGIVPSQGKKTRLE